MTSKPNDARLLKVAQVARVANVWPRTVWNDIARGALKVVRRKLKKRNKTRVPLDEAHRYAGLN